MSAEVQGRRAGRVRVLLALVAAVASVMAGLGGMPAAAAATPTLSVSAYPVVPTRGALWVALPSGRRATVAHLGGSVIGSSVSVGGHALLLVSQRSGRSGYVVTAAGYPSRTVYVNTSAAPLNPSIWRIVNKRNALPSSYQPSDLRWIDGHQLAAPAAAAALKMFAAARAAGIPTEVTSGFRSYASQSAVYNSDVREYGRARADQLAARPGFSEHQTGLAIDVAYAGGSCTLTACSWLTPTARWLAANSWRYGFVVRYQPGQTQVTGYAPEPWHVRYVGGPLAAYIHAKGVHTLESLFGLPAAPTY